MGMENWNGRFGQEKKVTEHDWARKVEIEPWKLMKTRGWTQFNHNQLRAGFTHWDWAIEKWDFHWIFTVHFSRPLKKQWWLGSMGSGLLHLSWICIQRSRSSNRKPMQNGQWSDPNDWEISPTRARDDCEQTYPKLATKLWKIISPCCSMRVGEWFPFFCHSFWLERFPAVSLPAPKEPLIGHYLYRLAEGGWKHGKRKAEHAEQAADAAAEPAEKR